MGTTAQKMQRVLDTKEGLKDTINTYLGQDITSAIPFKDYETYIKNFYGELPKTDYAEGSNITIENCLKGKLDYEDNKVGYGDTKQEGEPTPTTPIPIQVVTGEQEVVVRGLNKFKINSLGPNAETEFSLNGVTLTLNNDNTVTINGKATANVYCTINSNINQSGGGKIGTFVISGTSESPVTWAVYESGTSNGKNNGTNVANYTNLDNSITYTTTRFALNGATGNTFSNLRVVLMLIDDNTETTISKGSLPYEPYITPITKQLSLGDKELFEDSYIDRDSNGDFYFNDNWKRLLLNGSESGWQYSSDTIILTSINDYYKEQNAITIYSTIYKGLGEKSKTSDLTDMNNVITLGYLSNNDRLYIKDSRYTTASDYKTYLGTNNLNIVYKLAETIKTKITDTNLISQLEDIYNIQSVNGTTIIEINGNLPMIMKVRALKGA